jgi:hypothetical protein
MSSGSPKKSSTPLSRAPSWLAFLAVVAGVIVLSPLVIHWWQTPPREIDDTYGRRRGYQVQTSVNGTAVLAEMFQAYGRPVSTITELSPRVERYETIVWAPNSFEAPGENVVAFIRNWLQSKSGRTLIYIGRDFDAAPSYWQYLASQTAPADQEEYNRRWAAAQARVHAEQARLPEEQTSEWFTLLGQVRRRRIDSLDGPWAEGIDVAKTEIDLAARLDFPPGDTDFDTDNTQQLRVLLQSENDLLAFSWQPEPWTNSQVIVVANGSFTLNLPLVKQEHRKLAARLIGETTHGGDVAFLESGPLDPRVRSALENGAQSSALHLFTLWPLGLIMVHLAALGLAYCAYRFPLFGRAHRLPAASRADFGQHVSALGLLLERTREAPLARERLEHYHQQARRASGRSHAERKPAAGAPHPR